MADRAQHTRRRVPNRAAGWTPSSGSARNCGQSENSLTRLDIGLLKGQKVRILSGPFAEFVDCLEQLDDKGRVQVLLGLMGPRFLYRCIVRAPAA